MQDETGVDETMNIEYDVIIAPHLDTNWMIRSAAAAAAAAAAAKECRWRKANKAEESRKHRRQEKWWLKGCLP